MSRALERRAVGTPDLAVSPGRRLSGQPRTPDAWVTVEFQRPQAGGPQPKREGPASPPAGVGLRPGGAPEPSLTAAGRRGPPPHSATSLWLSFSTTFDPGYLCISRLLCQTWQSPVPL
ncbi:hypothetical protein H1C71_028536 [Ictidomys tridecemlineatus]|nr:hypothetical protein H1C71_028536 [Ictidomys tridecemlineatus]